MLFRCTVKTLSIHHAFCRVLLSTALLFIVQPTVAQPPITEPHPLSDEAAQLLKHIKTKAAEYDAQFKSGEIEFSITLSQKIPQGTDVIENLFGWFRNIVRQPPEKEKHPCMKTRAFGVSPTDLMANANFTMLKRVKRRNSTGDLSQIGKRRTINI